LAIKPKRLPACGSSIGNRLGGQNISKARQIHSKTEPDLKPELNAGPEIRHCYGVQSLGIGPRFLAENPFTGDNSKPVSS